MSCSDTPERLPDLERRWLAGLKTDLGRPLLVFNSVGSTQDVLADLAAAGSPTGTCVAAMSQSSGRGRQGRRWACAPSQGLLFSLLLRPSLRAGQGGLLSLAAALAIHRVCRAMGVGTELKWPNDVLIDGRKLAGVLPEARLDGDGFRWVCLGIGINIDVDEDALPEDLRGQVASLATTLGFAPDPGELLGGYLTELERLLADLESGDSNGLLVAWRQAWPERGVGVTLSGGEQGRIADIDQAGHLVVTTADGPQRVSGGDALVREES